MRLFLTLISAMVLSIGLVHADEKLKPMPDSHWKSILSSDQFKICREGGTERPGSGELLHHKGKGMYVCSSCGHELFSSDTKFDSGSGWPSFWEVAKKGTVTLQSDDSMGMSRLEVRCAHCGAHLGHLFDDGPKPTGKRYCVNSACLKFVPEKKK